MYAGFVPILSSESQPSLFYWLFTSEKGEDTTAAGTSTPLVIWLNGGPGASSLTGALLENGPIRLNADGRMTYNPFGWTQEAHYVAIDNPVGAGESVLLGAKDEALRIFTGHCPTS